MPAEVIMILQDQNARPSAGTLTKKVCCRQSADASPHYNQIVGFAGLLWLRRLLPESAVAQAVRSLKRARLAAPHARERGRIVTGPLLRLCRLSFAKCVPGKQTRAYRHRHAIEEVAPRDGPVHAQVAVVGCAVLVSGHRFALTPLSPELLRVAHRLAQ